MPSRLTTRPSTMSSSTGDWNCSWPTRARSWARTARHACSTAPPDIIVWRLAEVEPAEPIDVSAGATTTSSTPSIVRAICCTRVTNPWPTSAAAHVIGDDAVGERARAVEQSS